MFSCVVWWILLGSLLGTILSWALGNLLSTNSVVADDKLSNKLNKRVSILEKENAEIPNLKSKIKKLKKARPKLEHSLELENKDKTISDLKTRLSELLTKFEKASYVLHERNERISMLQPPSVDIEKAKSIGLRLKSNDDFEIIEGIGPIISILLNQNGIKSFYDLSRADVRELEAVLLEAGPNFRMTDPSSWPEQASLAAHNSWNALMAYQGQLSANNLKISNWE